MNILEFCKKYLINYTINSDNTIDVDGDVDLTEKLEKMTKLPVRFGKVSGWFDCGVNKLTTLEGCPNYVGASFWCDTNKLTALEYCPKYVGIDFSCEIITHHVLGNIYGNILTHHILRIIHGNNSYNKQRIII